MSIIVDVSPPVAKFWNGLDFKDLGAAGAIPIRDGDAWVLVYAGRAFLPGTEHFGPIPVFESARRLAAHLAEWTESEVAYPRDQLRILHKPIKTREDCAKWTHSIFNLGPVPGGYERFPRAIADVVRLETDDFHPLQFADLAGGHVNGDEVVVVPAAQGERRVRVVWVSDPASDWAGKLSRGTEIVLGPRHEITKAAFLVPELAEPPSEAPRATKSAPRTKAASKPVAARKKASRPVSGPAEGRGRGRPPANGLVIGSDAHIAYKEAVAAKQPVPEWVIEAMTSPEHQERERERNDRLGGVRKSPAKKAAAGPRKKTLKRPASAPAAGAAAPPRKKIFKRRVAGA